MRSRIGRIGCVGGGLVLLALAGLSMGLWWVGPPPLEGAEAQSATVLDRHDRLLRAYTTEDGRWRLPLTPREVDPAYLAMLFAFEDKRFASHAGVDPLAIARAGGQLLRRGRIVSGGSTLTMQVARLLEGRHERTGTGKLRQALIALRLERQLSKDQILALYLRLAPFGGNLEGARSAALAYFGKEPRRLSLGEAALLVAIPQAPELRRPDRFPEAARRARDRVLARAVAAGVIAEAEAERARAEPVAALRREFPKLAAHLADREIERDGAARVHRLTLDAGLQAQLETLAREHVRAHGSGLSAAIVVVDHASGEILAEIGSAGLFDDTRAGAVDMARAVRSPGSTLKPVIYGLAFDAGLAHPETLIEDRQTRFGAYVPKNFDHDWHGTVTIRAALAQSLNIPAVKVLDAVGVPRLYGRFQALGLEPVLPKGAEPTLAIALGGIGLRLTDLATLYASLARAGEPVRLRHRRDDAQAEAAPAAVNARLMSPVAAWYIADILRNAPPPAHAKPGQIAYKTGTSYGYRDAWSAGFDGRHTIAVWVGRPDGAAVPGLNGRATAAPLLFDAFQRISERRVPLPVAPQGVMKVAGHDLPPPLRRFNDSRVEAAGDAAAPAVQIAFPIDRSELEIETGHDAAVVLKAEGGTLPLTWLVDGQPIASDPTRRDASLDAPPTGFVRVSVIDARGRTDRVTVRVR